MQDSVVKSGGWRISGSRNLSPPVSMPSRWRSRTGAGNVDFTMRGERWHPVFCTRQREQMDIFTEIKTILMEILDLEGQAVTPESLLMQELGAESIDLLELAAALNAKFKIEVREEEIFLQDIRLPDICLSGIGCRPRESRPFLTEERLREIAADHTDGPAVRVKDLVSYVAWQQKKAGAYVYP